MDLDKHIHDKLKRIMHWVEGIPQLAKPPITENMFPNDLVLSIHNKLGTIHELISDAGVGFNAQTRSKDFERIMHLCGELRSDWLSAKLTHLLTKMEYERLDDLTRQLIEAVKGNVDDEAKW